MFKEIEHTLCISANAIRNGKGEIVTFEVKGRGRFKWPLKQGRMMLLRSDLVRLRSTLHLMATVMMHAHELQEKAILDRWVCSHSHDSCNEPDRKAAKTLLASKYMR